MPAKDSVFSRFLSLGLVGQTCQGFRRTLAEANVKPHNREECGSRRGNVLLARGLNRFDNWFEKDMDDFANKQLGWQVTQPQWLLEGRFKGRTPWKASGSRR